MADTHAPGPWVGNSSLVVDARGFPVATVHPARDVKPAAEAKERNRRTAALITAAPALLAALREACDLLEPLDPEYRQQVDRWADALAEAEGRRP